MLRTPFTILPIVALLLVFTSGLGTYFTFLENEKNLTINQKLSTQQKMKEWKNIESVIYFNMDLHRQNSRIIAVGVERDLISHYDDLSILEKQMDNDTYDDAFYRIMEKNLYDPTMQNRPVQRPFLKMAGTTTNLITFHSNNNEHTLYPIVENVKKGTSWHEISELNEYNETLSKQAYRAVVRQSKGLIYTQTSKSESGRVEQMQSMSIGELRKLYYESGLEEFKHLNLLAPAYITENGDIFGNMDIRGLNNNHTKKIVIIQSVPMYDFLEKYMDKMDNIDGEIENTMLCVKKHGQQKVLVSLIVSFILWTVAIYLILIYNSQMKENENKTEE